MPAIKKEQRRKHTKQECAAIAREHSGWYKKYKSDPEYAKEWHRKGNAASLEKQRARKTLAELMRTLLDKPAIEQLLRDNGLDYLFPGTKPEDITNAMALSASILARGIATGKPDVYAAIRDTIGEKPGQALTITGADGQPLNPPTVNVSFFPDALIKEKMSGND